MPATPTIPDISGTLPANWPVNDLLTPNRHTSITFDLDESVIGDAGWTRGAVGREVASPSANGIADKSNYQNMYFWQGMNVWTLKPVQSDISKMRERDTNQHLIIGANQLNIVPYIPSPLGSGTPPQSGLKEENTYHPPFGVSFGLLQAPSDRFLTKVVGAGSGWAIGVAAGAAQGDPGDVPVDRVAESIDSFNANQGFFVRWHTNGTVDDNHTLLCAFSFGQYQLVYYGDGQAELVEVFDDPNYRPVRLKFRYAAPNSVALKAHSTAIFPTTGRDGKRYIAFADLTQDAAGTATQLQAGAGGPQSHSGTVYCADSGIRGSDVDQSPWITTRAGHIAFEMRRDIVLRFQLSTLGYATSGTLIDLPDSVPPGSVTGINVQIDGVAPSGTSLTAAVLDADSRQAFVAGNQKPYVQFTFTGDGYQTPVLHGYTLNKPVAVTNISPGSFTAYNWGQVTVNAYDGEPSSQSGHLVIRDPQGKHARLRNRGRLSAKISTTFTPPTGMPLAGLQQTVVLHQGYAFRTTNVKKGRAGGFSGNSLYPDPEYRQFDLPLLGMWKRLLERVETTPFRQFGRDYNAPVDPVTKVPPPWKVTAVIGYLLQLCGFPDDQINIPDINIRLFPGKTGSPEELMIHPEAGYAEIVTRLAKNYLGQYVIWDGNAGARGQWRLISATSFFTSGGTGNSNVVTPPTPIASFVTVPSSAPKLPHLASSYSLGTYPVLTGDVEETIVPPDFNMVAVICPYADSRGGQWTRSIYNYLPNLKSFDVSGYPAQSDPNHPDYIGYSLPLTIVDPSLAALDANGKLSAQLTQINVDWMTNRYYDFLCHAQRLKKFMAQLIFVFDTAINAYRELRFQDPVSYNGQVYLVKSARIEYNQDHAQYCNYELIQPVTDAQ